MNTRIGQTFGAYRLRTFLGKSTYAEVYLSEHTRVQRTAVVKLLTIPIPPWGWAAFQQICTKTSGLVHPGIVPLLDFDQQDGTVFLVQEYLSNGSLEHHFAPGTQLPLPQVAGVIQQVAEALAYAHGQQMLHLGLTPSNLLLTQKQEVVVNDFGLAVFARSLLSSQVSLSAEQAAYLSPEQLQGLVGPGSDQYALAVCAYRWLCGVLPFQGNPSAIIAGHLSTPPPSLRSQRPDLPAEVEQVLLTALRKQPAERFGSIQAFAQAFAQASRQTHNAPAFIPTVPASPSGIQTPVTQVAPTQPASAVPPAPATPGLPPPGATPLPLPASSPPNWPQIPSGPGQMALPPYPQPSQPASARPRLSRRAAIIGAIGVGAAGVLTTLCTRTAWLPFLVKSLELRGASAAATPTIAPNPLLLYTYQGHKSEPSFLFWSPDSTKLISSANSSLIHVWDALTGEHASTFDPSTIKPKIQFSGSDVGWTASGPCLGWIDSGNPPVVHITNLANSQEIAHGALPPGSDDGTLLKWSPDGNYLAIGAEQIVILKMSSDNPIATFPLPHEALSVSEFDWSPDSNLIAVTCLNNTTYIWEISSGSLLSTYQNDYDVNPGDLLWSTDSTTLASGNEGYGSTIDIWNAQGGKQLYTYTGLKGAVQIAGWSNEHSLFAVKADDEATSSGKIFVWNASTHQLLHTLPTGEVGNALWSPVSPYLAASGTVVVSNGDSRALIVWNATTGQQLASYISPLNDGEEELDTAAWSPNGKYIAAVYDGDSNIYIWKAP